MQIFEIDFLLFQLLGNKSGHALPLTEHHHLFTFFADDVADDIHTLLHFGIISRLLVEDVAAVAYHTHLGKEHKQAFPVLVGQKMEFSPLLYKPHHLLLPLLMHSHLFLCHRHEEILVHSLGHLQLHVFLAAADEDVTQILAYLVQVFVTQHLPCLIG